VFSSLGNAIKSTQLEKPYHYFITHDALLHVALFHYTKTHCIRDCIKSVRQVTC
jgi:hypothetical protein